MKSTSALHLGALDLERRALMDELMTAVRPRIEDGSSSSLISKTTRVFRNLFVKISPVDRGAHSGKRGSHALRSVIACVRVKKFTNRASSGARTRFLISEQRELQCERVDLPKDAFENIPP